MTQFLATIVTAMLLARTKAGKALDDLDGLKAKLERDNFYRKVNAVRHAVGDYGPTLQAVYRMREWGWFSDDSPEQVADWLTEIIGEIKTNGVAGIDAAVFASDIDGLGKAVAAVEVEGDDYGENED